MKPKSKSSVSSSGAISGAETQKQKSLDVENVPDAIADAITMAEQLGEPGLAIVRVLRPALVTMARCAEQLAEVAG